MICIQTIDGRSIINLENVWRVREVDEGSSFIVLYECNDGQRMWETFSSEKTRDIRVAQIHNLMNVIPPLYELMVEISNDKEGIV